VSETRSAGASSISSPRRPALTKTVGCPIAVSSTRVGARRQRTRDVDDERLEHAGGVEPERIDRLQPVGRRARIVLVLVQGEGDPGRAGGPDRRRLAAGHWHGER